MKKEKIQRSDRNSAKLHQELGSGKNEKKEMIRERISIDIERNIQKIKREIPLTPKNVY